MVRRKSLGLKIEESTQEAQSMHAFDSDILGTATIELHRQLLNIVVNDDSDWPSSMFANVDGERIPFSIVRLFRELIVFFLNPCVVPMPQVRQYSLGGPHFTRKHQGSQIKPVSVIESVSMLH
jgi:hypothetical protein